MESRHQANIPQFPLEIWALVLGHLVNSNDFPEIWANCSKVSQVFRRAAELAFKSEALPEVEVNLSLMGHIGRTCAEVAALQFKGFSEDGKRVHYGEPDDHQLLLQNKFNSNSIPGLIHDDRDHGNLPILIEWTGKVYMSVCRGPASYHTWSERYKQQLRHVWLRPNTEKIMEMIVHHKKHEVSFLWQPMLEIFFKNRVESTRARTRAIENSAIGLDSQIHICNQSSMEQAEREATPVQ